MSSAAPTAPAPVLAIDLGGTKVAAALVRGATILERRVVPTPRDGGVESWMAAIRGLAAGWAYAGAGVAVTGMVHQGAWTALNPATLPVPAGFPLVRALSDRLGQPVLARNDAQAAAWGEFRYGAGKEAGAGGDMAFVTVSTGIGGGLVIGGRLLEGRTGVAGHVGITPIETPDGPRLLEEVASGSALAGMAGGRGAPPAIAAAALAGEDWAIGLMDRVVAPLALALRRLHLEVEPERVVVGGGLGLSPGYLDRLARHLEAAPPPIRPTICAAALGADAGLIGIADLVTTITAPEGEP